MAKIKSHKTSGRCNFKKLTIRILFGILIFSVLSMAVSAVVYEIMFARRELTKDSLEWSYSEIDYQKYPRTPVEFQSGENMLQGYFYGDGDEDAVIIVVHGMGGGADSHLSETLDFVNRGWAVFAFSGTGSRESEGDSLIGFSQMNLDLRAAIDLVSESYPEMPIFLYGHSMGAYASATVLDNCPEVKAAVLVAGFDRPVQTMYYHAALRLGPIVALEYPFLVLHNRLVFADAANESAVAAINSCSTPVLVVQGSADDVVPDDISIFGRRDEITNPNVSYILTEDPFRNRHSTPWRSSEGAEYFLRKSDELDTLRREYGAPLSGSVLDSFLQNLDKNKVFELDRAFMDDIYEFFVGCIP